ncbi:MAG: ABC transporter substrate-binding protein [Bosea sp. (in: a-proteobacteria)]
MTPATSRQFLISTLAIFAVSAFAAAPAAAQEGKLLLYTSQPNTDAQQTIDAFKAKFPKVDVSFVRDGTPRVMAKLQAEFAAGQPQADVLLIADSVTMEGLKRDKRLLAHTGADVSAYPTALHDKERMWFSTKLITTGIVYNTRATMKPTSWLDLVKPEAKGQVAMPSPLASGAALIHTVTLTGNLAGGWSFYEQLQKNGALAAGGNGDILRQVATGEKMYGMIVDFMPIREKAKGAPVEFVTPTEGLSAVTEPVAILNTTKNPEAAKAFVDFLLSREGQELAHKQGYVPAHPAVAPPEGFPARDALKLMTFDPVAALAGEAASRKRFADIFGQ